MAAVTTAELERDQSVEGWQDLFWTVFESSRNGMALLDNDRMVVAVNAGLCALLGRPRGELVGIHADSELTAKERRLAHDDWREIHRRGRFVGRREFDRPDGTRVAVHYAAHVERATGRELVLYVALRAHAAMNDRPRRATGSLSPREREITKLVALGNTSPEIAERLGISEETVRTH